MISIHINQLSESQLKKFGVAQQNNISLGNHMFQYALCRLIAHKKGCNFNIPYAGHLKDCFPTIDLGIVDGQIQKIFQESPDQTFDPSVFDVADFTHLRGYFQTEKYFEGYEDMVKSWFEMEMDDVTKSVIEEYPVDEYCYVHIRAGDNVFGADSWLIPKEYYVKAMNMVKEVKSDIKFLVVTDDVEFSSSIFPDIPVVSNSIMSDFKCLYNSRYNIISASSFSWWSAWLSPKEIVIAPHNWLNYNKPQDDFFFPKHIKAKNFLYT